MIERGKRRDQKYWLLITSSLILLGFSGSCSLIETSASAQPLTATLAQTTVPAALIKQLNIDELGQAMRGYDPVAYFQEQRPVLGKLEFQTSWQGAQWHFANAQNRAAFITDPERYMPAYGGFCTFGVALGQKLDSDPTVWLIENNRLYLFLNEETKTAFLKHQAENFLKASQNWQKIQYFVLQH